MTDQSATTRDESKRVRLIESAASAFARVGFERASVEEIADAANVGKGTVYLYFDTKDALFKSVLRELKHRLDTALASTRNSRDDINGFIAVHLLLAEDAADLFRCYISALFGVNRGFQATALEIFSWQQDRLTKCICRDGTREARPDTALIVGCINATAMLRTLQPRRRRDLNTDERLLMSLVGGAAR